MPVFRVEKGLYWDYWLTDEDILQVKLFSDWARLAFASFGYVSAIFGIIYLLQGSGLAFLFLVIVFVLLAAAFSAARSGRRKLSRLSPEALVKQRRISRRIPWVQVSSVELYRSRLSIRWDNRKIGLKLRGGEVTAVQGFLRFKVAERLTLKA